MKINTNEIIKKELNQLSKKEIINLVLELDIDNNLCHDILSYLQYNEEYNRYINNK